MAARPAMATVYTWDSSGTATSFSEVTDGPGTWSTSSVNWWNGSSDIAWSGTNSAVFGVGNGAAGTINVGNLTASAITFNAPGSGNYTLSGGTITLASSPTITANSPATINLTIAGTAGLTSAGPSLLTLGGTNTFTGGLTVSAGTLAIGTGGVVHNASTILVSGANLTVSGGSLNNGAQYVYVGYSAGQPGTLNLSDGTFQTTGPYLFDGVYANGTVNIGGSAYASIPNFSMGFSGPSSSTTNLLNLTTGGTLSTNQITGGGSAFSSIVNFNGGVLLASNSATTFFNALLNTTANVQDGGLFINTNGYNDTIAMSLSHSSTATYDGGLTKLGGGNLILSGTNNTYNGGTTVSAGTLQVGNISALGSGGLTLSGGTVDLHGFGIAVASLGGAAGTITDASSGAGTTTFTVNPAGNTTFSGVLANGSAKTLGLTVNGPGAALTLNGSNTFTGPTSITAGTLTLGAAGSLGLTPVTVAPGAVLDVSAYGTGGYTMSATTLTAGQPSPNGSPDINGTFKLPSGATLFIAGSNTVGALTVNGSIGLNSVTVPWTSGPGSTGGQVNLIGGGALSLANTTYIVPTALPSGGIYTLFTAPGGITGGTANLAIGGPNYSGRQLPTFAISGGTAVTLTLGSSGAASLTWKGYNSAVWDTQNTANWLNQGSQTHDIFYTADAVTFDDSANTANVIISGTVQPGSVTFGNNSLSYTLTGGAIGGYGNLTINGSGGVTLNSSNTYSGGTTLTTNAGLLNLGNSGGLGTGLLTISGGTLANVSGAPMNLTGNIAQTWSGSFAVSAQNGLNLGTGPVTLANPLTATVTGGTLTVGGAISGANSLTIAGSGTTVLAGSSNYSGGTVIRGGLVIDGITIPYSSNGGGAFGASNTSSSAIVIQNGATLDINGQAAGTGTFNYGITISGSGTTGQGALINSGANGAGSTTQPQCPNITLAANSAIGGSGNIYMEVYNNAAGTLNLAGLTLTKTGTNTFYVSNKTTVTAGTLSVSQGTLSEFNSAPYLGAADVVIGPSGTLLLPYGTTIGSLSGSGTVSLTNAAALTFSGTANANPGPFAGVISGASSALTKNGASLLTLTGSNTYTGTTSINGGTLQIGNGGNSGALASTSQIADGGVLAFDYGSGYTLTFSNRIYFNGAVANIGQGTTILNYASNSYTGGTVVSAGVLQLGNSTALGSGTLSVNGGALDLYGYKASTGTLTMTSGSIGSSVSGGTLTAPAYVLQGGIASVVLANSSGKSTPLTVTSGTPVLASSNTYSGGTNILGGGTLTALAAGALGSGTVSIQPGALLDLSRLSSPYAMSAATLTAGQTTPNGSPDIKGSLNLTPSSTLLIAGGVSAGTLTVNGNLGLTSSDTIPWIFGSGSDQVKLNGALSLTGTTFIDPTAPVRQSGTYTLFTFSSLSSGGSGNFALGGPNASSQQNPTFFISGGTAVDMQISAANLTWTGSLSNTWDVQTTKNWKLSGSAAFFYQGDQVTFDDTATATNVLISGGSIQPLSVTFQNSSKSYTLSGAAIAGNCGLSVNGSGGLTLASSNSFSGGTTLSSSAGVVNLNAAQAVGYGPLSITAGTLNAGFAQSPSSVTISGGAVNLNAANAIGSGPLSISGGMVNANYSQSPSSVAVSGGVLNDGAANSLGSGTLSIGGGVVNASNPQTLASVTLSGGRLNFSASSATLGSGVLTLTAGTLANNCGTAMALSNNNPQTWSGSFTVLPTNNGLDLGTGAVTISSPSTLTVPSGSLTVGGNVTLSSSLTVAGSGAVTLPGQITQYAVGGGLIFNGPGILTLSNANAAAQNNYTGQVVVNGGTLVAASNGAQTLPNGSGAMVTVNPGGDLSIAGTAAGITASSGGNGWGTSFNVNGGGVLCLSTTLVANGNYSWPIVFQDTESYAQTVNLNSSNGTAATVNGAAPTVVADGSTVGGGIRMGNNDSGFINSWGAAPNTWNAELCLYNTNNSLVTIHASNTLTMAGPIDDYPGQAGIPVNLAGPGLVVFSGLNTYGGATTISAGTLQIGNGGSVGTTGIGSIVDNSVLTFGRSDSALVVSNAISGNGSVVNIGSGLVNLSGTNSYTGPTTISAGTLQIGSANAIPYGAGTGGVTIGASGVLDVAGQVATVNGLSGTGIVDNSSASSGTLIVGNGDATSTFAGVLQDSNSAFGGLLALTKVGSGRLTLSGTNTYLDGTSVEGGTLQVGSARAIPYGAGAGDIGISSSGVLDLAGYITNVNGLNGTGIVDNFSAGTAALVVGNGDAASTFAGVLQNSNSASGGILALEKVGNGQLILSGSNTYGGGTIVNAGTLVVESPTALPNGSSLTVGQGASSLFAPSISASPAGASSTAAPGGAVAAVPEPGTLALLAAGVAAALAFRMRKSGLIV
jgi:fibronectin-binding autotransporter adhesin